MEKKLYNAPLVEVENIVLGGVLMGSPTLLPAPPLGPAPSRGDYIP